MPESPSAGELTIGLEEWLKQGEYVLSDVVVQVDERSIDEFASGRSTWLKDYVDRYFGIVVRVRCQLGTGPSESPEYLALIECAELGANDRPTGVSLEHQTRTPCGVEDEARLPVLVPVPETIQLQELATLRIRSLVRLQRLDQLDSSFVNAFQSPSRVSEGHGLADVVYRALLKDHERRSRGIGAGQHCDEIVQRRTQVVDAISNEECEAGRHRADGLDPNKLVATLRLYLMPNAVGLAIHEQVQFSLEYVSVTTRVLKPEHEPLHRSHWTFTLGTQNGGPRRAT